MGKATTFWSDLKENKELKSELKEFLNAHPTKDEEGKLEAITEFAIKKGYPVKEEELAMAKANLKAAELPISELEKVSGGASKDEMSSNCFADYLCMLAWNTCTVSNQCEDGLWYCDSSVSTGHCNQATDAEMACEYVFGWSCEGCMYAERD